MDSYIRDITTPIVQALVAENQNVYNSESLIECGICGR